MRIRAAILGILASAFAVASAQTTIRTVFGPSIQEVVPGEILIKFRPGVTSLDQSRLAAQLGGTIRPSIGGNGFQKILLSKFANVVGLADYLKTLPGVEVAETNGYVYAASNPNDQYYPQQWNLPKINWPTAYAQYWGKSTVIIASVDTGVNPNQEDLVGKVLAGRDFVNNDDNPMDDNGHGTFGAGIAAAWTNNMVGIAGTAPGVTILAVKVLNSAGQGTWENLAAGIDYAVAHGAQIINMSLAGAGGKAITQTAVENAANAGCILSVAAGNGGSTTPQYPAAYEQCIAVGGTDQNDARWSGSNYNAGMSQWVDVAAPSVTIWGCQLTNNYNAGNGTSYATPQVSAEAALLYSALTEPNPQTPRSTSIAAQVRQIIEANVVDVGAWVIKGRINLGAAVSSVVKVWLTGTVTLDNHVAPQTIPVTVQVLQPGTGTVVETEVFNTNPAGNFQVALKFTGLKDLRFSSGAQFLARRLNGAALNSFSPTFVDIELPNGDVTHNGAVDTFDLNNVFMEFGNSGTDADLNGDGVVDLRDLTNVFLFYGLTADS